jgi:hypothetical protein
MLDVQRVDKWLIGRPNCSPKPEVSEGFDAVALDGTSAPVNLCTQFSCQLSSYTYHPMVSLSRPNPSLLIVLMQLGLVLQEALESWDWSCCLSTWWRLGLHRRFCQGWGGYEIRDQLKAQHNLWN